MNDRTKQLEATFHAASELTRPEERERFLNEACLNDQALRQEVEALLEAAAVGEERFRPVEQTTARFSHLSSEPVTERAGAMIGRYKLLEKIGEGGMGVVYMAEQREPVLRKVALKIIKLGMDTRQVVARFEAERQALALMSHPHIAQFLDCGISALPWRPAGRSLQVARLRAEDEQRLWLIKAAPGTVLPRHSHSGSELTLVLKGAFFSGDTIYSAGDIEDADESTDHQPVVTRDGECLCLAVTEGPLRFRRWTHRLAQGYLGI